MKALLVMWCLAGASDAGTCVVRPNQRFKFTFDKIELLKLTQTLSDATCKPVILGPGADALKITIVTPEGKDYSAGELVSAVAAAVELHGYLLTDRSDRIVIAQVKKP